MEVVNTNLNACFNVTRPVIESMRHRKWGRIVQISSINGQKGQYGQANYAASKAGMMGMTKALAAEVASRGITVNCVAPGFIETAMTAVLTGEQNQRIAGNIPAGRLGTPAEIAAAVVYLASEEAAYVTGATLHVNGGLAMI
jgi:NAD(P)-dependent dehydrogenase (short-subunit alcohol dehydrogenase family)